MKPLSICLLLIALLVLPTISTYADESDWTKTDDVKDDGVVTASTNPSSFWSVASSNIWASDDGTHLWMGVQAFPLSDDSNSTLEAETNVTTGCYCRDKYDWTAGGTPENHSFEISWVETFTWKIKGDADNMGGGAGTSEVKGNFNVTYSGGPGDPMACHDVEFESSSKKVEDTSWFPKILKIKWKPISAPEITWDNEANGTDDTFEDVPDSADDECADHDAQSENIDSGTSNNVWAKAMIDGGCYAKGSNDSFWNEAMVDVDITDFELEY